MKWFEKTDVGSKPRRFCYAKLKCVQIFKNKILIVSIPPELLVVREVLVLSKILESTSSRFCLLKFQNKHSSSKNRKSFQIIFSIFKCFFNGFVHAGISFLKIKFTNGILEFVHLLQLYILLTNSENLLMITI